MTDPGLAARELMRRKEGRASLKGFAKAIDVPGRPVGEDDDAWLFNPVESPLAYHHEVILEAVERCILTRGGRLMIFAPPGSAKSSYASVVAPAWACGKIPGSRVILASYAQSIAEKQSKRARQICRSAKFSTLYGTTIPKGSEAAGQWALDNGSEFMATGIMGAVTGSRASVLVIDDPVAGREEADSETIRDKTWDAYIDDLSTRLIPGASVIIIQTRWHEDDLSGRILPEDYDGASGVIRCRDGRDWEVLNIQAKAERLDDPLHRPLGGYMWPEWFDASHWAMFESNPSPQAQRTWTALFQQRPAADTGGQFERAWFDGGTDAAGVNRESTRYRASELPPLDRMRIFGGSDWAVTEKTTADFTEHGVWGVDDEGTLWALDWDYGQVKTDVGVGKFITLVKAWHPIAWAGESGKDENAVQPWRDRAMIEQRSMVAVELLPNTQDKIAKVASFRALASLGRVRFPRDSIWAERVIGQLVKFPVAAHDDAVDVCGLAGRMIDRMWKAPIRPADVAKPRFLHETTAAEVFDLMGTGRSRMTGSTRL